MTQAKDRAGDWRSNGAEAPDVRRTHFSPRLAGSLGQAHIRPPRTGDNAMKSILAALALSGLAAGAAHAATAVAPMSMVNAEGTGAAVGTIRLEDSAGGVKLILDLHGLPAGEHGLHLHQNPSCQPATADGKTTPAGAAGGHFDPAGSKMHMGPEGAGHLGDLPRVQVADDGTARATLVAPRIKSVAGMKGHALMLHAGGDNYTDQPPLGGGGARLACGVVG
jgi:Cu-Zn family superoxide dismutase